MQGEFHIPQEDTQLSLEVLQRAVPQNRKSLITKEVVDSINSVLNDSNAAKGLRENLLGYLSILQDSKFRLTDYLNAVRFVSHRLNGDSHITSYTKTFPARYQRLVDQGVSSKDIAAHVHAYSKTALVAKVLEKTLVPSYILNQDLYQKAINTQAELMMTAKSEKVRSDAANSLMNHLKMPEVAKVEVDVKVKEDDSINELRNSTLELVRQQRLMLQTGLMTPQAVGAQKIVIDVEGREIEE